MQRAAHRGFERHCWWAVCGDAGCEVWNAWLDALKWKPAQQAKGPAVTQPLTASSVSGGSGAPASALFPRVTLYRITLPVGSFSSNDKIWAQLNEDAISSSTAVLMAQNGLRAATGDISRWPGIARMLDTPGASNDQVVLQTDGKSSINVVTRQNVTDQIVVSVDHDHQLQGRTFERLRQWVSPGDARRAEQAAA